NYTYLDTMAWVLFKRKEYKEALEFQRKAIEIAEQKGEPAAEFYNHLGDILFMNHNPEEALENWKKALQMEPDNALLKKKVNHKTFFFE
ncbi:MAG: tetratricopeptide repeat protein, partial [Muribaculaceae bacterium]|nr:tetratricopeptide repeat protein [Muribaculaceae bacterium]